ncbi:trypsin-like serine peptidase [Salinithrix halophila]|uniref:Serine protease n=1 Tax=Salinithrix halophila TaxID=1485204 RepID=A0ABV8JGI0_9BACL
MNVQVRRTFVIFTGALIFTMMLSAVGITNVEASKGKEKDRVRPFPMEQLEPSEVPDESKKRPVKSKHVISIKKIKRMRKTGKIKSPSENVPLTKLTSISTMKSTLIRISDPTKNPYNGVVFLASKIGGEWYRCSGTLIDANSVLTAAHCVYDNYNDVAATYVTVYPGEKNGSIGDGYNGLGIGYTEEWVDSDPPNEEVVSYYDVQYDFAVVNIDTYLTKRFTWPLRTSVSESEQVATTGYPAAYGYYMYKSVDEIADVDSIFHVISHNARQLSGMSGGPAWNSKQGRINQIGIISAGDATPSWACKFNSDRIDLINYWKGL